MVDQVIERLVSGFLEICSEVHIVANFEIESVPAFDRTHMGIVALVAEKASESPGTIASHTGSVYVHGGSLKLSHLYNAFTHLGCRSLRLMIPLVEVQITLTFLCIIIL